MKIIAFLFSAVALMAQSLQLSLVPSSAVPGQQIVLNGNYTDASPTANLAALQAQLALPPSITPPQTGPTGGNPNQNFVASYNSANLAFIIGGWGAGGVVTVPPPLSIPTGPVFQWTVTVPPTAPLGTSTLTLTAPSSTTGIPLLGSDVNGNAVALTVTPVTLTVTSIYDINGDGVVNQADIQAALRIALNLVPNGCVPPFSLVGDKKCDVTDVVLVWRAALGLIH